MDITHINKISLKSPISFKSIKGYWDQRIWEPVLADGWTVCTSIPVSPKFRLLPWQYGKPGLASQLYWLWTSGALTSWFTCLYSTSLLYHPEKVPSPAAPQVYTHGRPVLSGHSSSVYMCPPSTVFELSIWVLLGCNSLSWTWKQREMLYDLYHYYFLYRYGVSIILLCADYSVGYSFLPNSPLITNAWVKLTMPKGCTD